MDGNKIYQILRKDKNFAGVLAADEIISKRIGLNKYYVVNTSSSYPGIHWIVIGRENNRKYIYFDPAGKRPDFYQAYFQHFLDSKPLYTINKMRVQSLSLIHI